MDFIVNISTGILVLCQACVLKPFLITKSTREPLKLNNEHVGCYCLVHNQKIYTVWLGANCVNLPNGITTVSGN